MGLFGNSYEQLGVNMQHQTNRIDEDENIKNVTQISIYDYGCCRCPTVNHFTNESYKWINRILTFIITLICGIPYILLGLSFNVTYVDDYKRYKDILIDVVYLWLNPKFEVNKDISDSFNDVNKCLTGKLKTLIKAHNYDDNDKIKLDMTTNITEIQIMRILESYILEIYSFKNGSNYSDEFMMIRIRELDMLHLDSISAQTISTMRDVRRINCEYLDRILVLSRDSKEQKTITNGENPKDEKNVITIKDQQTTTTQEDLEDKQAMVDNTTDQQTISQEEQTVINIDRNPTDQQTVINDTTEQQITNQEDPEDKRAMVDNTTEQQTTNQEDLEDKRAMVDNVVDQQIIIKKDFKDQQIIVDTIGKDSPLSKDLLRVKANSELLEKIDIMLPIIRLIQSLKWDTKINHIVDRIITDNLLHVTKEEICYKLHEYISNNQDTFIDKLMNYTRLENKIVTNRYKCRALTKYLIMMSPVIASMGFGVSLILAIKN